MVAVVIIGVIIIIATVGAGWRTASDIPTEGAGIAGKRVGVGGDAKGRAAGGTGNMRNMCVR